MNLLSSSNIGFKVGQNNTHNFLGDSHSTLCVTVSSLYVSLVLDEQQKHTLTSADTKCSLLLQDRIYLAHFHEHVKTKAISVSCRLE